MDRSLPILSALFLLAASFAAQSVRLNGPLVQPLAGDVTEHRISRAGTHVAFRADQDHDEVFELFAAPLDGSAAPARLHAPLGASSTRDVLSFAHAAGDLVVYVADLGADETFELYAAPLAGTSSPTLLSGALASGGDVQSFELTPDGTRAVFLADKLSDGTSELFSVPVDGSAAPLPLDPQGRPCILYRISPDGALVLYTTPFASFDRELLFRVPTDASALPVLLANSGPPGFVSYTFFADVRVSSDNLHATFAAVELFFDRGFCGEEYVDLFGISLDGGQPPAKLTLDSVFCHVPEHVAAADRVVYTEEGFCYSVESDGSDRVLLGSSVSEFLVTPDESQVVFLAGSPTARRLYAAPIDGSSPPVVLDGPGQLEQVRMSAASSLIVYISTHAPTSFRGLFTVQISGGTPLLLNGPVIAGGRGALDFAVSPNGLAAVYREDRAEDDVFQFFSATVGPAQHELSGPLGGFRDVGSYEISPDGQRVVYLADQNSDEADELFGTEIDSGSPLVQYNPPLPSGPVVGDVLSFQAGADGSRVVYRADEEVDEFIDLYSVPSDGRTERVRLTAPLPDEGDVGAGYLLTPAGDRVVFQLGAGPFRLHSRSISAAEPAVTLETAPYGFEFLTTDPSGTYLFYRKSSFTDLMRVPIDGSQPANIAIDPPAPGNLVEYRVTPDGLSLIYLAHDTSADTELYRIPSDASVPEHKLNPSLVDNGDVTGFRISPNSARVVYRADQQTDGRFELFSVPTSGGVAVKLNGPLVGAGDVSPEFEISADGSRVVYRADQTLNNTFELYSVPTVGGAPSLRLTPLLSGRVVEPDFVLSPDGALVLYRADALLAGTIELFVVPTDGSASPVRVNEAPVAGGDVTAFALGTERVAYLADQRADEVFELFSAPHTGGTPLLLTDLAPTADVTAFRVAPAGERVVYLSDSGTDEVFELFRTPLDASAPQRLNDPLPAFGDVQPDFVPLAGGSVLYRADGQADDAFELFHFLNHHERRAGAPSGPMVVR